MNTTIRDRTELLLAKIAGRDVSIASMTPSVASNLVEKLLLDIAARLDDISASVSPASINSAIASYFTDDANLAALSSAIGRRLINDAKPTSNTTFSSHQIESEFTRLEDLINEATTTTESSQG